MKRVSREKDKALVKRSRHLWHLYPSNSLSLRKGRGTARAGNEHQLEMQNKTIFAKQGTYRTRGGYPLQGGLVNSAFGIRYQKPCTMVVKRRHRAPVSSFSRPRRNLIPRSGRGNGGRKGQGGVAGSLHEKSQKEKIHTKREKEQKIYRVSQK